MTKNAAENKIRVMETQLSSKIAAGEVVERPASIVKELMENSIDSGASEITVAMEEGGRSLIRVIDNGEGMSPADLKLSIVRHATSKIIGEEDLEAITTMGFRGEALSSIASVSRMTIKTKRAGDKAASTLKTEGGLDPKYGEEGSAIGTTIEVRDLFFNTPARAKFLRTPNTEKSRITDTFKKLALSHPSVRFRLLSDTSKIIETAPGSLADRIGDIFGSAIKKELVELTEEETPQGAPRLSGFIAGPGLTYATGKGLFIFINHRPVRDPGVVRSILGGYGSLIDRGRYPLCVLSLKMNPADVDVNVHPTKNEVRFSSPGGIFDFFRTRINKTLGRALSRTETGQGVGETGGAGFTPPRADERYGGERGSRGFSSPSTSEATAPWNYGGGTALKESHRAHPSLESRQEDPSVINPEFLEMDVIGQVLGEYLICQPWASGDEFILIDQHGAAERTRYEALRRDFYSSKIKSQLLLLPERIETTPEEADALVKALPRLTGLGFEIADFGPSTKKGGQSFMIRATPEILASRGSARLITELAEELAEEEQSTVVEEIMDSALMRIACHSVIRGARKLDGAEAHSLLAELAKVDFAAHCPHGRPVVKKFSRAEIEAIFKRT